MINVLIINAISFSLLVPNYCMEYRAKTVAINGTQFQTSQPAKTHFREMSCRTSPFQYMYTTEGHFTSQASLTELN